MTHRKKLGELLLEAEAITVDNLQRALEVQSASGERLGSLLLRLELVDARLLASALARQQGVEAVDLQVEMPSEEALGVLTREQAYRLGCVPLRVTADELAAAFIDPRDEQGVREVARVTGRQVRCLIAPQTTIYSAIMRYYPPGDAPGR
jgi:type IV pilus assembly protein PilB